ncbi:hypothetical protein F5882DRAFT_233372, partial [Hyaloscypha sp. PMI_1271]
SRPFPTTQLIYNSPILNCTGKNIVAPRVTFPPSGSTRPHTHGGAFLSSRVVSGYVFNKKNGDPMELFGPGGIFHENLECRYTISDN